MNYEAFTWMFTGVMVAAIAALVWWVLRSFRRWPATRDEGRSSLWLWGRRGGGDM